MIVSFSGIDSAGKTTQIELLRQYCESKKINTRTVWSKARGTPGVLLLKAIVRRDKNMNKDEKSEYRKEVFNNPKKEKLLYIASMLDLCWYWGIYYRILGKIHRFLICDRYLWDTYVEIKKDFYGIDIDSSKLWRTVKALAPKPAVSFVFIIPAELSLERDHKKNAAGIEEIEIKKRKIETYMQCVSQGCWSNIMDGTRKIDELHAEVKTVLGI